MLNKPKFMRPSANKEECTIDLTADSIPFSCIVDGNESINAWQIVIYDINDDKKVYDTGQINLTSPFYPVDEKNRNVVFTKNLKDYPSIITESLSAFVNRAEAYYWTITLWGSPDYSITSYQEVFYANETPDIGFNIADGAKLSKRDYTFKATYRQADGIQLKRYGWKITDTDNGQVLLDTITKNQIYGSADNIICNYNGFLNGSNYSIELYIETQNNTKITRSLKFSVSYATTFLSSDFKTEALGNEPAIMLDWNKALVIAGILKEKNNEENIVSITDTKFKTNYPVDNQCSIKIPDNFKVVYDDDLSMNFDIDESSYITLSTQLLSQEDVELFFAEGNVAEGRDDAGVSITRKLTYTDGRFMYEIGYDGETIASSKYTVKNKPTEYVWYNIFMSPLTNGENEEYTARLDVYEGRVENCIYPSKELYPSDKFYPIFGNWTNLKNTSNDTGAEV